MTVLRKVSTECFSKGKTVAKMQKSKSQLTFWWVFSVLASLPSPHPLLLTLASQTHRAREKPLQSANGPKMAGATLQEGRGGPASPWQAESCWHPETGSCVAKKHEGWHLPNHTYFLLREEMKPFSCLGCFWPEVWLEPEVLEDRKMPANPSPKGLSPPQTKSKSRPSPSFP